MNKEFTTITERLDTVLEQLAYLTERQRKQEELIAELTPIAKLALGTATEKLDQLDQQGYFAFGKELVEVAKKVIEGFSPQDVHELGDAVVQILQAVRAMTQPAVLAVAADASSVMDDAAAVKPLGMFGMVRATRDDDVQKGMAIMIEVLRRIGHGANAVAEKSKQLEDKKAKLQLALGSRKQKKPLGIERKRLTAGTPAAPRPAPAAQASCAVPAGPQPSAAVIDGIAYTADGHLVDATAWTRRLGETLAQMQGVTLTDAHWAVLEAARADYETTAVSPNIRRLTQIANVTTKDLYALFPKAPGRTIAKIAGLPKPAGCL
ncbi:MAG: TusE/DsrC/DsvC family sulfur relay protein [Myxococcales bacterium]|nr:TusE/DsrC/DsvC family sulfur relay protein [Myxococcales bacterium]